MPTAFAPRTRVPSSTPGRRAGRSASPAVALIPYLGTGPLRERRRGRATRGRERRDAALLRAGRAVAGPGAGSEWASPLRRGDRALAARDQGGAGGRLHAGRDHRVPARGTPLGRALGNVARADGSEDRRSDRGAARMREQLVRVV